MFHEDAPRAKSDTIRPGEDLSHLAIEDLEERKAVLENEIDRTDAMIVEKKRGREAADAVFRTG